MPANRIQPRLRVTHPVNTRGTTWLKDSDLIFLNKNPVAVFAWKHEMKGDVPAVAVKLNPKLLKHDAGAGAYYRYEGEIADPRD